MEEKWLKRFTQEEVSESSDDEVVNMDNITFDADKFAEVDTAREPLNVVFIGHVDSGKSTICGMILVACNAVDKNELKRMKQDAKEAKRETWWAAYVMDLNPEERQKGKTVEVGKAFFQTNKKRFTILDAPGHKNYVPNMIKGAAQADLACLVISAREGEFEAGFERSGQTNEHAHLVKSLGVDKLVIVINKMDSVDWSQKRYDDIRDQLTPFIRDEAGFNMENVKFCPISGLNNLNIKSKVDSKVCAWYTGGCLLDVLDNVEPPKRDKDGPVRLPILDSFVDEGKFYIYGKLENGSIQIDSQLVL